MWSELFCLKEGPVAGLCEHGYEPSGFVKGRDFLGQLSNY
jgi:hypothetical protein